MWSKIGIKIAAWAIDKLLGLARSKADEWIDGQTKTPEATKEGAGYEGLAGELIRRNRAGDLAAVDAAIRRLRDQVGEPTGNGRGSR